MLEVASTIERRLPPGRHALIELNREMLATNGAYDPSDNKTTAGFVVDVDPAEAERLADSSPLGKIMLGTGDSLLKPYADPNERAQDLVIGDVNPCAVELTASHRSWRSTPVFTASNEEVDYSHRWLGVGLWYGEKTDEQKGDAVQRVGVGIDFDTGTNFVDMTMGRLVVASGRLAADRFYYGHNEKQRSIKDKRTLQVAELFSELLAHSRPA